MIIYGFCIFRMVLESASDTAPERILRGAVHLVRTGFQRKEIGDHACGRILLAEDMIV